MTDRELDSRTIGQVVGENLLRLRQDRRLTQHEAARQCQAVGLNWSRVRVAAIERGDRETVDVGTLLLLAEAFEVTAAEFFAGPGAVRLAEQAVQSRAGARQMLSGGLPPLRRRPEWPAGVAFEMATEDAPASMYAAISIANDGTDADQALAERLGVELDTVIGAAVALWRRTLTGERDRRVRALGDLDTGERQAHRGHITRELAQEIEQRIGGATA